MLDKNTQVLNYNKVKNKSLILFKLINKYFWKSIIGPVFAIVIPLIFMTLYYAMAASKYRPYNYTSAFGGIIAFTVFPICFFSLTTTNLEFKKSIFLRKLKNEGFSKVKYLSILIGFYLMIIMGFCILNSCFFFLFCLDPKSYELDWKIEKIYMTFKEAIQYINFLTIFVGFLLMIIQTISFALLISVIFQNPITVQFTGFGIMLVTLLLAGQLIPVTQWVQISFLKYLTLANPIGYPVNIINIGVSSTKFITVDGVQTMQQLPSMYNIFNFKTNVEILYSWKLKPYAPDKYIVYFGWEKPIFIFIPIILSSVFIYLNVRLFKWSNR